MRQLGRKVLAGAGLLTLACIVTVACTDFSHTPASLGHIKISVVDSATNVGVPNLPATLYLEDKTTGWRALFTSADGTGEFGAKDGGVIPGKFLVFLDLTGKGYVLATGDENYKAVRSVIGQTVTASFRLRKTSVGGPPGS